MRLGLLTLVQWLSPAFPTGAFAYSHGLETVVGDGAVRSARTLADWLEAILRHGAGWQDAVLLALALRDGADHAALDALARALQPSAERMRESREQGAAFALTVAALTGRDLAARSLPVSVGEAAAGLGLPPAEVIGLFLHAFAGNLVTVGVRFVPLGQTEGQAVLAGLHPVIGEISARASRSSADDIATSVLAADLAAMRHETQDVRIYKT